MPIAKQGFRARCSAVDQAWWTSGFLLAGMCAPIIVRIAEPNHARKGGFNLPREVALEPASGCGYGDHAAHPGRAVAWQGATKRVVAHRIQEHLRCASR